MFPTRGFDGCIPNTHAEKNSHGVRNFFRLIYGGVFTLSRVNGHILDLISPNLEITARKLYSCCLEKSFKICPTRPHTRNAHFPREGLARARISSSSDRITIRRGSGEREAPRLLDPNVLGALGCVQCHQRVSDVSTAGVSTR